MPIVELEESDPEKPEENMAEPVALRSFAIAPGQENLGYTIDCTSLAGLKLHNAATKELQMKFDCDSKNVGMFCEKLIDKEN